LNHGVSQLLSQVIHRAMAKQPWHRYGSAREFADKLQKALRNEPISDFDPSRTKPRIERAQKAFDDGDQQFASEILSELEAEGHIDPAISFLRLRIDQVVRQKKIYQLLEMARTRLKEGEHALAMQKAQEVRQLDPKNAEAQGLIAAIENESHDRQIDEWLALARQHIEHQAFQHARQALDEVLRVRPDTRAADLLREVDRLEQKESKSRQEKEKLYQQAQQSYQSGEISAALSRLEHILTLIRSSTYGKLSERDAAYQTLYNLVRSEHDSIEAAYAEGISLLAQDNFLKAQAICEQFLNKYPGHPLFQGLKLKADQKRSAYVVRVSHRVDSEPDLDRKFDILKEALTALPEEPQFQSLSRMVGETRDLVNKIVIRARHYEDVAQFNEALGQWEILRSVYSQYPGLDFEIERVAKRRDDWDRKEAKARGLEQIDGLLKTGDFELAFEHCQQALAEFPDNEELIQRTNAAQEGIERSIEAQRWLAQGQMLFAERRFEESSEALRRANELSTRNPMGRAALVSALAEQANLIQEDDLVKAEALIEEAIALDSGHTRAKSVRLQILGKKKDELVDQCISKARGLEQAGDLRGALEELDRGLAVHPKEARLGQQRTRIDSDLKQQERQKDLDAVRRLEREAEATSDAQRIKQIGEEARGFANKYPEDREIGLVSSAILGRYSAIIGPAAEPPPPQGPPAGPATSPESARRGAGSAAGKRKPASSAAAANLSALATTISTIRPKLQGAVEGVAGALRGILGPRYLVWTGASALVVILGIAVVIWLSSSKRPVPPAVTEIVLEVHTKPSGAALAVDPPVGHGFDAKSQIRLPAGRYRITARLDGYQDESSSVRISPNSPSPMIVSLPPLQRLEAATPPTGAHIVSDLPDGKIQLDNGVEKDLMDGQIRLGGLASGPHTLKFTNGPQSASITFHAESDGAPVVDDIAAEKLGVIVISQLGDQARVRLSFRPVTASLDGKRLEVSDDLNLAPLASGSHHLDFSDGVEAYNKLSPIEAITTPSLTVEFRGKLRVVDAADVISRAETDWRDAYYDDALRRLDRVLRDWPGNSSAIALRDRVRRARKVDPGKRR
jgi:tetratricopeptide (TPR) repeat protein